MSLVNDLVNEAKKFLKNTWNEDTVSMTITKNEVVDGDGKLHTDCVVRLVGSTSKWHKIFTFRNGEVIDEKYHLLSQAQHSKRPRLSNNILVRTSIKSIV